jgi:hypothetical protein
MPFSRLLKKKYPKITEWKKLASTYRPLSSSIRLENESNNLARRHARVLAVVARTVVQLLRLLAVVVTLELDADLLSRSGASVGDSRTVAVVGVDAGQNFSTRGLDVLDGDGALGAVALAVSTGAVQFAEVEDAEAVDGHGRGAVVLDHLVFGVAGATAFDHGGAGALEGEGVFADGGPPDV